MAQGRVEAGTLSDMDLGSDSLGRDFEGFTFRGSPPAAPRDSAAVNGKPGLSAASGSAAPHYPTGPGPGATGTAGVPHYPGGTAAPQYPSGPVAPHYANGAGGGYAGAPATNGMHYPEFGGTSIATEPAPTGYSAAPSYPPAPPPGYPAAPAPGYSSAPAPTGYPTGPSDSTGGYSTVSSFPDGMPTLAPPEPESMRRGTGGLGTTTEPSTGSGSDAVSTPIMDRVLGRTEPGMSRPAEAVPTYPADAFGTDAAGIGRASIGHTADQHTIRATDLVQEPSFRRHDTVGTTRAAVEAAAADPDTACHPLVQGLLMELPGRDDHAPDGWMDRWLETARAVLELLYHAERRA